ncbi:aminoacyl-tRNA hydrolase [Cryobacterium sp. TMT2-18-3]|uniref:aminoacyl-tRNA hydrolase n=1 Tax=unclassified Cryobacterium TaxID=2649013 RepID=UPI00106B3F12|nr:MULTISPECIES: aminoacyl-tRNA hydrolase [unclassified Cryobacterium]TFC31647.1 aminoacyl-tRNA hydrolase [Cryobacterium sp. TMT2-18-2]TFC33522.1 aminoacyl-tRNA hydrolase [Cryobacterium sp. TMT2-42-4]TFC61823.1 aminoacyl-tRNA hydrolase [Cryobacterium sp. TMT2-15-1]TFC67690.1 aminoacyl-tRNA hydrolase [Cryobacterium sp. TMT2-18-3]
MDDNLWLVVGLGNPGPDYASNRHNVGHMVATVLADRVSANFKNHKTNSSVAEGRSFPGGPKLVLAKPNTYMNVTGGPVAALLRFYSLEPARLIVIHDDLDLPFDTMKIKVGGGHGGHNGLRDIIAAAGTNEFIRIRVGIGRPPGRQPAADFVLHDFTSTERSALPNLLTDAADAIQLIAAEGVAAAQQKFHAP